MGDFRKATPPEWPGQCQEYDPVRQLDNSPFGITINQKICLGIGQNRTSDLVGPVIVMSDTAKTGLDGSDHYRNTRIGLLYPLRINQQGTVGSFSRDAPRRIGIIRPDFPLRRIAVDHRIHIPRCHAEIQLRPPQRAEIMYRFPVRLGNDADFKSLSFQNPSDNGGTETGMIDIGISRNDDDIAGIPAECLHFLFRHGKERSGTGPFHLARDVGKNILCNDSHIGTSKGSLFSSIRANTAKAKSGRDLPRIPRPIPVVHSGFGYWTSRMTSSSMPPGVCNVTVSPSRALISVFAIGEIQLIFP